MGWSGGGGAKKIKFGISQQKSIQEMTEVSIVLILTTICLARVVVVVT